MRWPTRWPVRLSLPPLVLLLIGAFGIWLLLQLLSQVVWALVLFLLAAILAAAMMPVVRVMRWPRFPPRQWRIPRAIAVLGIYLTIAGGIVLLIRLVGDILITELFRLIEALPLIANALAQRFNAIEDNLPIPVDLLPSPDDVTGEVQTMIANALAATQTLITGLATLLFRVAVVLILALFFVTEGERLQRFWLQFVPPDSREYAAQIAGTIGDKMGYWLLGQAADAALTGLLAGIVAELLGLPYAFLIGVVTGAFALAPVIGPLVLIPPIVALGLLQSPTTAILAGLGFFAIEQLHAHVFSPLITGRSVSLSPAYVVIAVTLGFALYGPIGVLVAIPVAAMLNVLVTELVIPWAQDLHSKSE